MRRLFFALFFMLLTASSAHQPRFVTENLTVIYNPEISQAFYGELNGNPEYFQINSGKEFNLYLGILVPDTKNIEKDVSLKLNNEIILNGLNFTWTYFFEEFAGDNYYKGLNLSKSQAQEFTI